MAKKSAKQGRVESRLVAVRVADELKVLSRDEVEDLEDLMDSQAERATGISISHEQLLHELGLP